MNYKMILNILSWVLKIEAFCMLLPLACAICYGETAEMYVFLICALLCLIFGVVVSIRRPENKVMYAREGFVAVALSWVMLSIFGAFPFVFSKSILFCST